MKANAHIASSGDRTLPSNTSVRIQKKATILILVLGALISAPALAEQGYYVAPLLKTTWAQRGDYATFSGGKRLGCWSLAAAQILFYHRLAPVGTMSYNAGHHTVTFSSINWNLIVPSLKGNVSKASKKETSRYCFYAAVVMGYNFETDKYTGNSDDRRRNLGKYYPVVTQRYRIDNEGREIEPVKATIISELSASRPLFLYVESKSGAGHALVIDGLDTRKGRWLVHLNFGWGGKSDGWYEFLSPFATALGTFDKKGRWVMAIRPTSMASPTKKKAGIKTQNPRTPNTTK
jgi:hypothetical protein